jgi:hypothetical protein
MFESLSDTKMVIEFLAVHPGQAIIQQKQVWGDIFDDVQCLKAVRG